MTAERITMQGADVASEPAPIERVTLQSMFAKSTPASHRNETGADTALNQNERSFLNHMMRWGSNGHPVRKLGSGRWIWDEFCGVKGAPTVYRTKRECSEAIERYIDILVDKSAGRA